MSGKNHEKSELELFRRELLNKDGMIEVLQNNVKELQEQLQNAYKRIEELNNVKACECPPIVVSGVDGNGKPY
jgi:predicted RNase H-like nuclease (RuvC/YqgF family)